MAKYDPCDPYSRFLDLQKQGFMRAATKPVKAKKEPKKTVMVACGFCSDWHYKNKHTLTKEERDANVKAHKERDPNYKPIQRVIGD